MSDIAFLLNGTPVRVVGESPTRTLLDYLREVQGLKGTKEGCNEGDCGACTVMVSDEGGTRALNSCILFLPQLHGKAVRTVEGLLGIDVDQVAIIDFDGFRSFIDTIGGIDVDLPTDVCSEVSGGAFALDLEEGENHLNGFQAITLARTRTNTCSTGEFAGQGDLERAQFQQLILDGIKGKLTSITALPMNFLKGPLIGWNAPKAMVSSMGALTMPQLVVSAAIGGGGTDVLKPSGTTAAGNLVISPEECERAAEELLGEPPPRSPNCPQG